jgi:rhamnosyltransferase subunit B
MARVLLAWEFGAGLGHLNRLLPVGERLAALGHDVTFAVPDPDMARPVIARRFPDGTAPIVSGPRWRPVGDANVREVPTDSFADVLRLFDAHRPPVLRAAVEHWDVVLAKARPDLIVADFAPTLALAAAGVPRVVLGNGYTVPPPGRPLPPMRPWVQALPAHSRAHEAELLDCFGPLHHERQGRPLRHLADLFSGDRTFVCTIAAFDPYGPHRRGPTCMPFNVPRVAPGPPVAERVGGRVALYMPVNHPQIHAVLAALGTLGTPCDTHIGSADPAAVARIAPPNVTVHERPLALEAVLPAAAARAASARPRQDTLELVVAACRDVLDGRRGTRLRA